MQKWDETFCNNRSGRTWYGSVITCHIWCPREAELGDQDVQRRNHVLPGEAVTVSGPGTRVLCRGGLHAAALLVCDRVRQAVRFTMT